MDTFIFAMIGFTVGMTMTILVIIFVETTTAPDLNDVSIQCDAMGYNKAFISNDIYYCGHELERIQDE